MLHYMQPMRKTFLSDNYDFKYIIIFTHQYFSKLFLHTNFFQNNIEKYQYSQKLFLKLLFVCAHICPMLET